QYVGLVAGLLQPVEGGAHARHAFDQRRVRLPLDMTLRNREIHTGGVRYVVRVRVGMVLAVRLVGVRIRARVGGIDLLEGDGVVGGRRRGVRGASGSQGAHGQCERQRKGNLLQVHWKTSWGTGSAGPWSHGGPGGSLTWVNGPCTPRYAPIGNHRRG